MDEPTTEKVISRPEKVSFKKFKETCHVGVYGRGKQKLFIVYYGKDPKLGEHNPYWMYKVYPYGYRCFPPYGNTQTEALKMAYHHLFESTHEARRREAIREGEFKIAIAY